MMDIIFYNSTGEHVRGLVTETYDRNHTRDYFSEQTTKKADLSVPNGCHRHHLVRVTKRPATFGNEVIVLGTREMNAIFPLMVCHAKDGSREVEIGASSGVGLFKPCDSTAVYLSKASIDAAKKHIGNTFNETFLPRLAQLRSIRQGFDQLSAYFSARAGNMETMPPTIFTLWEFDCTPEQQRVSRFFAGIACNVWTNTKSAVLKKGEVQNLANEREEGLEQAVGLRQAVDDLLEFFKDNDELLIIGNKLLSRKLAAVAVQLDVRSACKKVVSRVAQSFSD